MQHCCTCRIATQLKVEDLKAKAEGCLFAAMHLLIHADLECLGQS